MQNFEQARVYADAGFRVLRVKPDGKEPVTKGHGAKNPDATTDPGDWRPGERVAILCGPTPALGDDWLLVLDLDGGLTEDEVSEALGGLPPTLASKGGAHLYYRVTPGAHRDALMQWKNVLGTRAKTGKGLDLKWCGGYAVEPWTWCGGFDPTRIATLPVGAAWALVGLEQQKKNSKRATVLLPELPSHVSDDQRTKRCRAYLDRVDPAIQGQDGSDVMWRAANECNRFGIPREQALTLMREYSAKCVPPWEDKEIHHKLKCYDRYPNEHGMRLLEEPAPTRPAAKASAKPVGGPKRGKVSVGDEAEIASLVLESMRETGDVVCTGHTIWQYSQGSGVWEHIQDDQVKRAAIEYSGSWYRSKSKGDDEKLKVSDRFANGCVSLVKTLSQDAKFFSDAQPGVAFRNGFLVCTAHPELLPHSAANKCRVFVDAHYDRDATSPEWERFLESAWSDAPGSARLCNQIMGYLLSGSSHLQKIPLLIGPKRAGKGTIFKLLHRIIGDGYVAFTAAGLRNEFGLAPFLGKSVAVDPDFRRPGGDESLAVARMLAISAGDAVSINVKRKDYVTEELPTRLVLGTNPPFGMADSGGAFASRLIPLKFTRSFYGKEDFDLVDRLVSEIPGIVNAWMRGYAEVIDGHGFTVPDESRGVTREAEVIQDPTCVFFDNCCEFSSAGGIRPANLYKNYKTWCEARGQSSLSLNKFGPRVRLRDGVRLVKDTSGMRWYLGVRMTDGWDRDIKPGVDDKFGDFPGEETECEE